MCYHIRIFWCSLFMCVNHVLFGPSVERNQVVTMICCLLPFWFVYITNDQNWQLVYNIYFIISTIMRQSSNNNNLRSFLSNNVSTYVPGDDKCVLKQFYSNGTMLISRLTLLYEKILYYSFTMWSIKGG